ncbi:uncharacterized protein LOC125942519 [Dermacentor silvarum]|uniref:uncharacterized protein LOC125942519 n=1 Tax=Dermacentor silvarum TaxID=543639 RepID=UPI0021006CB7|nr:uncharacterized protein LOC125942519 [Dermacentor silvarum]
MVKRLKLMTEVKEREQAVVPSVKIDIGGGVLVEETVLAQLTTACHGGPGKFARALLRHVLTEEELVGRSLFWYQKYQGAKEALDPTSVKAVIGFTCHKFPATNMAYIKNTLASLLARDIKCQEESKAVDSASAVLL